METTEIIRILRQCGSCTLTSCEDCPEYHRSDSSHEEQGFMWSCGGILLEAADRLELMEDVRKDIWDVTNENHRLKRQLKYTRAERDAERAKITRLIGMVHKEWLEKVHPDWYDRLEKLEYNYNPVKDGTPWYRAEDVWACIEEVAE